MGSDLGAKLASVSYQNSILGPLEGLLEASWGLLEASWGILEASWGILEPLGGVLDASSGGLRRQVGLQGGRGIGPDTAAAVLGGGP